MLLLLLLCVTVGFTEGNPDSDCPPVRAKDKGGREYKSKKEVMNILRGELENLKNT